MALVAGFLLLAPAMATVADPVRVSAPSSDPEHFVFFGLERDRIRETSFLETEAIAGAQLKYTWKELEPEKGQYELRHLRHDLAFLERNGKKLFVQLQDVSFFEKNVLVPDYLRNDPEFGGGADRQFELDGDDETTARPGGWVARRWDASVEARFVLLLQKLGEVLDGRIAGINLPETSVEFGESGQLYPRGFTPAGYVKAIQRQMSATRSAFPRSHVIQYANFMPGEWLPWNDRGYLRAVYEHAERIGVGVGGPDLLPHRKGQQTHSHPLIAERGPGTIAGVAVQDGNFAIDPASGERTTAEELLQFATERLRLDYMFWGTEEPYYSQQVLPLLRKLSAVGATEGRQPAGNIER